MIQHLEPCMPVFNWPHVAIMALQVVQAIAMAFIGRMVHRNGRQKSGRSRRSWE